MNHESRTQAQKVAELLKACAWLALAVYFVNAIIEFVHGVRYDFTFGGFLGACWEFVKNIFMMGVIYLLLSAAGHILNLLLDIEENTKKT